MKYAYFNNVLNSRVYLHYKKYSKTKNITKKIAKKKTLKAKWNRRNTYLLNWWRFTRKLARDCRWKLWRMERKQNWNLRWKTEEKKKWTEGAVAGTYMAVLPMDSPTNIKLIIILIYSVGEVSKIRR
jgi:hypothetical protein